MTVEKRIDSFSGKHDFLSNFSAVEVTFEGWSYPSVEHAYQAAKTLDLAQRGKIAVALTANAAKKLGRKVTCRPSWEQVKDEVMLSLLRQKFAAGPLRLALLATGDAELIEGNWWGDTYWGVCKGVGKNTLGRLLMQVRREINTGIDHPAVKPAPNGAA